MIRIGHNIQVLLTTAVLLSGLLLATCKVEAAVGNTTTDKSMSAKNFRDGIKFLDGLSKTCNGFSDYTYESELVMAKKGKDDNTNGLFYFKKPNLVRAEDKSDSVKNGSVVVKQADGKIRASGGTHLRFLKMNLTSNSRLLLLPNGFNLVQSDFDSLLGNVRHAIASGSKIRVTTTPVMVDKLNKKVYILEVTIPDILDEQLTDRIFVNPDNNVPLSWDVFKNGSLYSSVNFKNFRSNIGLSDDLFKL